MADKAPAAAAVAEGRRGEVVDHPAVAVGLAASRSRLRRRHWAVIAAFLMMVALPSAGAAIYLYVWAADQYASRVSFAVRAGESVMPTGLLGALTQTVSLSGADAEIVFDFVRSQPMVAAAREALPLDAMFNRAETDVFFRLGHDRPIEEIVDYWNWMTSVSFDAASGIVRFEARAFTPQDARMITEFVLEESSRVVNQLSQRAQEDSQRVARQAVADAEARLRAARRAMREFRDAEQEIDPTENARSTLGLVASLEQELAETRVALDSELALVGPRSPRILPLRQRIDSITKQITSERARLGSGANPEPSNERLSEVVARYEELLVDLEFAQNTYLATLTSLEQAQIEARRQSRFLVPHIIPTESEESRHPQRAMLVLAVLGVTAVVWMVTVLIIYNVRDRH